MHFVINEVERVAWIAEYPQPQQYGYLKGHMTLSDLRRYLVIVIPRIAFFEDSVPLFS